ncbi:hypothetical protein L596_020517 [Steinernema carpocapsae]|uniref:Uncharacterized protein n=1 Tax=Steinernema carpocapsae TaxID=34508 RepID=A0A4U5MTS3_STECR|nr:hypothetical protein L596_020517 [Steinernema carpocapsae]
MDFALKSTLDSLFSQENEIGGSDSWKKTMIKEVSFKPVLWQVQDANYMRKDLREQAWAPRTIQPWHEYSMQLNK